MKLLVLILASVGWCFGQSENTIDITGETVKQVESLIAKDPKLPRLTRGEIISLINEVRNNSSTRGDKSLLVVLPYNGTGSQLEELYTKPPVTTFEGETTTTKRPKRRRKKPTTTARPVYVHSTGSTTTPSPLPTVLSTTPPIPVLLSTTTAGKPHLHLEIHQQPYKDDLDLPQPMKETLVEISVHPDAEIPIFITPEIPPRPTAPPVPSDVKNTADALTPDIKQVLNSIGIFGESTTEKQQFQLKAMSPSIDPTTYSRFKPLPTGSEVSEEMKSFLKTFGLLEPPSNRQQKAMKEPPRDEEPFINEYILTDDMKQVLKDIGLMERKNKKMHVFNPQEQSSKLNQTEHMIKINKILKKLREISEGSTENISQEELKELLALEGEDSNKTLLDSELDPDVLKADEYQSLDTIKYEVKRQQPNITAESSANASASADSSSGSSASASASASASVDVSQDSETPTTEQSALESSDSVSESGVSSTESSDAVSESGDSVSESGDSMSESDDSATDSSFSAASDATERTPSLDDLADSFGGEVSTPRPNGFYFLLDWNSFFDVGLDERKISLNFSPKVGDPKNFLPVSIP